MVQCFILYEKMTNYCKSEIFINNSHLQGFNTSDDDQSQHDLYTDSEI